MEFAFYHSLVDDDQETARPALQAIGRVTAAWARLEHHLDALIIQINKPHHCERIFEPKHPISFSKKIELLKRWFNQYPPLSEYTEDMRYLTSKLKSLSKEDGRVPLSRNVLLHAIPASYEAASSTLTLHHMEFLENGDIRSRHIALTLGQLSTFFDLIQMANGFLATITREIFTPEGYAKLRKQR